MLTALLYIAIPKGLFPIQDTGLIQGVVEAAQTVSYAEMGQRQRQMAEAILPDPDVENVSSFVGVDAQNTTLNTARVLIELKPLGERHASASEVDPPAAARGRQRAGRRRSTCSRCRT